MLSAAGRKQCDQNNDAGELYTSAGNLHVDKPQPNVSIRFLIEFEAGFCSPRMGYFEQFHIIHKIVLHYTPFGDLCYSFTTGEFEVKLSRPQIQIFNKQCLHPIDLQNKAKYTVISRQSTFIASRRSAPLLKVRQTLVLLLSVSHL